MQHSKYHNKEHTRTVNPREIKHWDIQRLQIPDIQTRPEAPTSPRESWEWVPSVSRCSRHNLLGASGGTLRSPATNTAAHFLQKVRAKR